MTLTAIRAPVVRTSLADLVYNRLLEDILSGTLGSGAALNVADIAAELQVSPSPVREALLRLATEGLADNNSNRRATVVSFTNRDVTEIFGVRELLECGAAEQAATKIDDAGVAKLRTAVEQCAALADDPSRKKEMLDLDNRFHLLVAEVAGNRMLLEEIVRCNRRVRVMQWLHLAQPTMRQGYPEHMAVVHGLAARDPAAARAAMKEHMRLSRDLVLAGLPAKG